MRFILTVLINSSFQVPKVGTFNNPMREEQQWTHLFFLLYNCNYYYSATKTLEIKDSRSTSMPIIQHEQNHISLTIKANNLELLRSLLNKQVERWQGDDEGWRALLSPQWIS